MRLASSLHHALCLRVEREDCSDEHEAKIVARKLTEKGTKVVAQMFSDGQVLRAMEAQDLRAWLSK
jgi:hypothetical protein